MFIISLAPSNNKHTRFKANHSFGSSQKQLRYRSEWMLDSAASYVIAGGLGGLGRALCLWMASKGARYLILPSRSGARSEAAQKTVQALFEQDVTVLTPVCDVSSWDAVSSLLAGCSNSMPPIKGCINAAMTLQDGVFENMTYEQWDLTMKSKVHTSWNLHKLLPNLDFYIFLSSLSGLYGNISLSNYAAGCTFQDSLAHARNLQGQKTFSLDIGWMKTIGVIAESELFQRNRERAQDMRPIEEEELLAMLDVCCDPSRQLHRTGQSTEGQILIGCTTPVFFLSRGEEPIPQLKPRIFSALTGNLQQKTGLMNPDGRGPDNHIALFQQATDPKEKASTVVDALVAKLARALSVADDYLDTSKTLTLYGVDSLMAVELRNWFINVFNAKIAVFDIMGNTTIASMGDLVVDRSEMKA